MEINREMLLQSFREETEECLAQMEQSLLALETHPEDRELISSLFRAAHTIKGNASLLEFDALARFLHNVEDLLDLCRNHTIALSQEVINILLQAVDALRQMAKRAVDGKESLPPEHEALSVRLAELASEFKAVGTPAAQESSASSFAESSIGTATSKATVQNLRVDVGKLDRMLNLTVEFAIAQGRQRRMLEEKTSLEASGRELLESHHGLEMPEVRRALGKDPSGKIVLQAFHDSGNIVVQISDDGAGLDHERILHHARSRGIIPEGARLTESEIHNLIFQPGFSTADKVSELSGRGVGLDVVRRNVNALSGAIQVESRKGQGTTFTIRLPLTLAIIDGFAVKVGTETYVIPLSSVQECLELPAEKHGSDEGGVINLRGEALPFVRLRDLFECGGATPAREKIIVVEYHGGRAGLAADELLGEQQALIKPLGRLFQGIPGVSGSTILGNGRVALILDVPALCAEAIHRSAEPVSL